MRTRSVDESEHLRIARVGDHAVVVPLEATVPGSNGGPTAHLVFDEIDGRLECRQVLLIAEPGGREIRKADLRAVVIDEARDEVMTIWSAPWETTQTTEGR